MAHRNAGLVVDLIIDIEPGDSTVTTLQGRANQEKAKLSRGFLADFDCVGIFDQASLLCPLELQQGKHGRD
jgi:hypothetical protein